MNKKAIELSINFLVIFIFSIVIFSLGVLLMWRIFHGGSDITGAVSRDFDQRLQALNCRAADTVCVGSSKLDIKSGENVLIDVIVFNNHNSDISLDLIFELRDSNNVPFTHDGVRLLPNRYENEVIPLKEDRQFTVMVNTQRNMPHGDYSLRIMANRKMGGQDLQQIVKRVDMSVS